MTKSHECVHTEKKHFVWIVVYQFKNFCVIGRIFDGEGSFYSVVWVSYDFAGCGVKKNVEYRNCKYCGNGQFAWWFRFDFF